MALRRLKVLFAEPPPARRVGGIETALRGLAGSLPHAGIDVVRSSDLVQSTVGDVDLVHFHGLWEWSHHRARTWCRRLNKPFVVSPHGMLEDWAFQHRGWKKRPYFHLVERPSVARAQAILATSAMETGPLLRWFPPEHVHVLPLGAHPPRSLLPHPKARAALNIPPDEYVLLFLSRCHEKKGLHLLIEALPKIAPDRRRPLHLMIVGDGDPAYVNPLQRATAAWNGSLRCTWVGARWGDEKWVYLSAADLLCLPSFSENFGLAVLEALFVGTPVLTTYETPWPALRGSLPLHFTRPSTVELMSALQACIEAPTTTEDDRAAARDEAIGRFNWSTLAPRYAELYAQVVGAA